MARGVSVFTDDSYAASPPGQEGPPGLRTTTGAVCCRRHPR